MTDQNDDFFVGWAELPERDRRFFLKAGIGLTVTTAAAAAGFALAQRPPSPGAWNLAEVREFRGQVVSSPYPMLRTTDVTGAPVTALLACETKCGVQARLDSVKDGPVIVRGSLIQRGPHAMITVIEGVDWIEAIAEPMDAALAFEAPKPVSDVTLDGEILDTKCWFGAMNPNEGKPHKACASLCIRGGIPPAFYVRTPQRQRALMILTHRGQGFGPELLPFVADPVRVSGKLSQWGDLLLLDTDIARVDYLA
ncbi:MAG: hypothetical protein AAFN07_06655 [Pseudomonadota bacterium]